MPIRALDWIENRDGMEWKTLVRAKGMNLVYDMIAMLKLDSYLSRFISFANLALIVNLPQCKSVLKAVVYTT